MKCDVFFFCCCFKKRFHPLGSATLPEERCGRNGVKGDVNVTHDEALNPYHAS